MTTTGISHDDRPMLPSALPWTWKLLVTHGSTMQRLAFLVPFTLILASLFLGTASEFQGVPRSAALRTALHSDTVRCAGFATSINWGMAYLVGLPLMTLLTRWFLAAFERGLRSVDGFVRPDGALGLARIDDELIERYRDGRWIRRLLPVCLGVLTLAVDSRDIGSPWFDNATTEYDWSNCVPVGHADSRWLSGMFNVVAFTMQASMSWLTITALLLVVTPLYWILRDRLRPPGFPGTRLTDRFKVAWQYDEPSARCGLGYFDEACLVWVILQAVSGLLSLTSFSYNENSAVSLGENILIVQNGLLFLPWVLWLIVPHAMGFPSVFPAGEARPAVHDKPRFWPIIDASPTLGLLALLFALFSYQLGLSKGALRPFLRPDHVDSAPAGAVVPAGPPSAGHGAPR